MTFAGTAFATTVLALGMSHGWAVAPGLPPSPDAAIPPEEATKAWYDHDYLLGDFGKRRTDLEDQGVTFIGTYIGEEFGNPVGGQRQGQVYTGLLDLELTLDLQELADVDGIIHASANYSMGDSLSARDVGDLLGVSGTYAYNSLVLFELWYEQKFLHDKVSIRFGQMGADSEFFIDTNAALFLGNTYGWPAIIDDNVPTPSQPYGAPGIRLRIDPDEHWTFLSAVFAGNPSPDRLGTTDPNYIPGRNFDNSGTEFNLDSHQGFFSIFELSYKLNQQKDDHGLPGTYKVGGWLHTGFFSDQRYDESGLSLANPDSDGHPKSLQGNHGFYLIADQAAWHDKSNPDALKEVDLFTRAGNAQGDRSLFDYYVDGGIFFHGLVPGRPLDSFGAATAYGHIGSSLRGEAEDENSFDGTSNPSLHAEQNIEMTYLAQVTPWWSVQPDLQVIIHPGGSSAIPNAVVLGLHTVITF
jgi:porin